MGLQAQWTGAGDVGVGQRRHFVWALKTHGIGAGLVRES